MVKVFRDDLKFINVFVILFKETDMRLDKVAHWLFFFWLKLIFLKGFIWQNISIYMALELKANLQDLLGPNNPIHYQKCFISV